MKAHKFTTSGNNRLPWLFTLFFLLVCVNAGAQKASKKEMPKEDEGTMERLYCINALRKIADPVLYNLSRQELKKNMPVISNGGTDREKYTYLEAFGRLLAGMAPWLALGADDSPEGKLRKTYIDLAVQGIRNATDPQSADYMNFNKGAQPVVDAAFLAQALLRAPKQLWEGLDTATKQHLIRELKSTRVITSGNSNWLLFNAIIEAALLKFDGAGDRMRMNYAITMHKLWYKGDGVYGDGPSFHWDYYNSFVIQPMLLEVLQVLVEAGINEKQNYELALKRAQRYAAVQERFISPEGTYPPIGRSLAYRFGAFQALAKIALMEALPKEIAPRQVRAALYTVIKKQMETPGTFDAKGWLQIGFNGHQHGIGESYISTGSLYLCAQAFLILGLPENHVFWKGKDEAWTSKKAWSGEAFPIDHAQDE